MFNKILYITGASLLLGIGVNGFIIPLHLLNGGVVGISILLNYAFGLPIGLMILLINLPLFLYTLFYERHYFVNGMLGVLITATVIDGLEPLRGMLQLSAPLSATLGGLFIGSGVGLLLRRNISHGATDLLALLILKYFHVNPGISILVFDFVIILTAVFLFGDLRILISFLTVFCVGTVSALISGIHSVAFYANA
ncbi:MAG: YitT family protein [Sporolactobacillus sp.]